MSTTQSASTPEDRKLRVFLCHASADKPAVRNLYRRLIHHGVAPWLDEEQLLPGQVWQQEIPAEVRNADVVIVCLSKSSITKEGYVQKEIRVALDVADEKPPGTIFIIPARLEGGLTLPQRLSELQWVDLFQDDGYQRLLRALNSRAKAIDITVLTPEAMFDLGQNYYQSENYDQAHYWYEQASDVGHSEAMNMLGVLYNNAYGVPRDYQRARHWQQKAAEAGSTSAMRNVGYSYECGRGVPQDLEKARQWYQKAADLGNKDAKKRLLELSKLSDRSQLNPDAALAAKRAERLEAIREVARQTTAVLDLDELLTVICRLLLEWFNNIDQATVLLCEGEALRLRAYEGRLTPKLPMGSLLPSDTGVSSRALSELKSIICDDVKSAEGYSAAFEETQSEMSVPLTFFGEKLGVLALSSATKNAFDLDDTQPLEAVADICAAAIQNTYYFESMRQLAYVDGLTGVHNRRYFEMRIQEELERALRFQSGMAVIMVDVDHFKTLNDEFGHLMGDEVLRGVAGTLKQQLRKIDMICRYGGDEFSIVAPELEGENALALAENLRCYIEAHPFPGVPRPVTISCGVARFRLNGKTRDELVGAADKALQTAQRRGGNRVLLARS